MVSTHPPRRRHSEPITLGSAGIYSSKLSGDEYGPGIGEDDLEIRCAGPSIVKPDKLLIAEERGRRGPATYTNSVATW